MIYVCVGVGGKVFEFKEKNAENQEKLGNLNDN